MREVVSFLRCVVTFFYFSREQKLVVQLVQSVLSLVMCGWHCSQSSQSQTFKQRDESGTCSLRDTIRWPVMRRQWVVVVVVVFLYINRFIDFAHHISEPNCSVCCRKTHLWAVSFKWVNMWDSHCFTLVISLKMSCCWCGWHCTPLVKLFLHNIFLDFLPMQFDFL